MSHAFLLPQQVQARRRKKREMREWRTRSSNKRGTKRPQCSDLHILEKQGGALGRLRGRACGVAPELDRRHPAATRLRQTNEPSCLKHVSCLKLLRHCCDKSRDIRTGAHGYLERLSTERVYGRWRILVSQQPQGQACPSPPCGLSPPATVTMPPLQSPSIDVNPTTSDAPAVIAHKYQLNVGTIEGQSAIASRVPIESTLAFLRCAILPHALNSRCIYAIAFH